MPRIGPRTDIGIMALSPLWLLLRLVVVTFQGVNPGLDNAAHIFRDSPQPWLPPPPRIDLRITLDGTNILSRSISSGDFGGISRSRIVISSRPLIDHPLDILANCHVRSLCHNVNTLTRLETEGPMIAVAALEAITITIGLASALVISAAVSGVF